MAVAPKFLGRCRGRSPVGSETMPFELQGAEIPRLHSGRKAQVTAKIARIKGIRIYEVGISYYGRTYEEGKKIGWRDGVRAIYCILKYF